MLKTKPNLPVEFVPTLETLPLEELAKYGIDEFRRDNLIRLAAYLEMFAADLEFGMRNYMLMVSDSPRDFNGEILFPGSAPECGTVCCAAGHGVYAGIEALPLEGWFDYTCRCFVEVGGGRGDQAANWMFSGTWSLVDDTIEGAVKRIRWLLQRGVPDRQWGQSMGHHPLCYV